MRRPRRPHRLAATPAATARAASRTLVSRREPITAAWVDRKYASAIAKTRALLRSKRSDLPTTSALWAFCDHALALDDEAMMDVVFSQAHANPERIGCPPHATLATLATTGPSSDPVWQHIEECGECAAEIRGILESPGPYQ